MQRLGRTIARLAPARLGPARALLAGAAILAGAAGPVRMSPAGDTSEDTAMAIPRFAVPGSSARIALPRPIAPSEAQRIRRIFALHAKSDIPAAIAETEQLTDTLLLPDILADRYLAGGRRTRGEDLAAWLAAYKGLPDAPAIYALLADHAPVQAARLGPAPAPASLPRASAGDDVEPVERLFDRKEWLDRAVHDTARVSPARALRLIARTKGLTPLYRAQLRAEAAQALFAQGEDAQALEVALEAHQQARGAVGLAPFVAGLAAWRLGQHDLARTLFEASFGAALTQPGQRAGAAFWSARLAGKAQDAAGRTAWLRRAAENGRTFYGLLARSELGIPLGPDGLDGLTLGEADVDAVDATVSGHRAFALLQVGRDDRAAAELQSLWAENRDNPSMARSIMLVARQANLTGLAGQLAMLLDPAPIRLPVHRLRPTNGFKVDPALIYALARLESNFDPHAVSRAGARGLMQLMPSTIDFILRSSPGRRWHDPSASLDLGQRYLLMLAQYDLVGGDLIRLLASYNSGPGGLAKWIGGIRHNNDPLLFIESIPNDETRAYVPRALAYCWLYGAELKLPTPSLSELAAGRWPRLQHDRADEVVAGLP